MALHTKILIEYASQAIRAVFNDTTVSHHQTLESLELLRDEIDGWIDAVGEDIESGIDGLHVGSKT